MAPSNAFEAVVSAHKEGAGGHWGKVGNRPVWQPGPAPAASAPVAVHPAAAPGVAVPALTPPISPLEAMRLQMAQGAAAASHGGNRAAEDRAEIAAMQHTLATAQLTAQQRVQIETELAQKQVALANEGRSGVTAAARRSYADFAAAERMKITAADGSMTQIVAVYNQWLTAAEGRYKQSAAVIEGIERQKTQAINTARLHQIREGATTEEAVGRTGAVLAGAAADVAHHQQATPASAAQVVGNLAAQAAQVQAQAQAEVQSLLEVMNTATQGSNTQKEAANEVLAVVARAKQQEVELYNKAAAATKAAAQKTTEPFTHMFDSLGSQFTSLSDSLVKNLLAPKVDLIKQGLTTIKINEGSTQIHAILQKFALDLMNDAVNTLEKTLFGGIGKLVSGGISSLLGVGGTAAKGLNAAQFGLATTQLQTASMTLQTAALALQAGAGATSVAGAAGGATAAVGAAGAGVAPITQAISAMAATDTSTQVAVGAASNAAGTQNTTLLGGIIQAGDAIIGALLSALNIKPSFLGFTYSQGGVVPSAAGGMVVGGNGGSLAVLHAQEMVLPAHLSRGIQGMIQGGGARGGNSAHLNYSPTINTGTRGGRGGTGMTRAEFAQTMAAHGGRMMGEARNMMRAGWRPG